MDEEANDRDVISATPDVIELKGVGKNSTRKTIPTRSLSFSISDGKILPRYLSSSMGSCHDLCKNGRKGTSEAVMKQHFRHRSLPGNIIHDKEQNQVESLKLGDRMKKPLTKPRASPQLKFESSDTPEVNKKAPFPAEESGLFPKQANLKFGTPSPFHKRIVSARQAILPTFPENEVNQVRSFSQGGTENGEVIKLKTALHSKVSPDKSKIIKQKEISLANEIDASSESIPSANFQVFKQKVSSPLKRIDLRKTTVVKPTSVLSPLRSSTGRINQEAKIINSLVISKVVEKKVLQPPSTSLSPKTPEHILSTKSRKYRNVKSYYLKSQENFRKTEHDSDGIRKKILCVVEPKLGNLVKKVEGTSGPISETQATERKVEISREDNRRHIRNATVHPMDSLSKSQKLMFKRGKVVDLKSEISDPRRLRFRRGTATVKNPNANDEIRKGSGNKSESSGFGSNDCGLEVQSVLLRHQDMHGKKNSQCLLNHVIEETATKLVETRKSKVKALVGAFEIVISLQERKPTSAV